MTTTLATGKGFLGAFQKKPEEEPPAPAMDVSPPQTKPKPKARAKPKPKPKPVTINNEYGSNIWKTTTEAVFANDNAVWGPPESPYFFGKQLMDTALGATDNDPHEQTKLEELKKFLIDLAKEGRTSGKATDLTPRQMKWCCEQNIDVSKTATDPQFFILNWGIKSNF